VIIRCKVVAVPVAGSLRVPDLAHDRVTGHAAPRVFGMAVTRRDFVTRRVGR
jgi:hypothetical protein